MKEALQLFERYHGWTSRNIQNEEYADIKILLARDDKRHCQLESVEDYCTYRNPVNCEKESEDCTTFQCDSCKRWAHMPCITEGTNQDYLTEEKKEYNCKKCA
ncbi:unnamed protein product [Caretta caretta]